MSHPSVFPGLDVDQQDSAQVAALAGSQVHPESALPSRTMAERDSTPWAMVPPVLPPPTRGQVVDYQTAIDSIYPVPDSPHASVTQRAHDNRIAFSFGWQMCSALSALRVKASWTPASRPPDADITVMLALADGEVWQGYFDGEGWIEVSGLRLQAGRVTYWQHTPKHPEDKS